MSLGSISSRRGASLVAYALLAGLVSVAAVGAVTGLGGQVETAFSETGASLSRAVAAAGSDAPGTAIPDDPTIGVGEAVFRAPGTHSWTVPAGVHRISAVAVGAGGGGAFDFYTSGQPNSASGGGGGLAWRNAIDVTPGDTLTVTVGAPGARGPGSAPVSGGDGGTSEVQGIFGATGGTGGRLVANGSPPEEVSGQGGTGFGGDASYAGGDGTVDGEKLIGGQAAGYYESGLDGISGAKRRGGGVGLTCGPNPGPTSSPQDDWFGGGYGGGGSARSNDGIRGGGGGNQGGVRIVWGRGRAFPDSDCGQAASQGNVAVVN